MRAFLIVALSALTALPLTAAEPVTGRFVEKIACAFDPTQSYSLYLPTKYTTARKWPVLLVMDPRGRSVIAGEIFRQAAEARGWIILSSNDTRSDGPWEPNVKAMGAMWAELDRYPVDGNRIYAAGFSGGATVAWVLARATGKMAGVISSGGVLPPDFDPGKVSFAHFASAGMTDFNFMEMHRIDALCAGRGMPHRLEVFEGRHQWLPQALASEAVDWLELVAMKNGSRSRDEALIAEVYAKDLAAAQALEGRGNPLDALRRYQMMERTFGGLRAVEEVSARVQALEKSKEVTAALRQEREDEQYERSMYATLSAGVGRISDEHPPSLPDMLSMLRVPELQRAAARPGSRGVTASRVLEWLFTRTSFYLAGELLDGGRNRQAALALEIATNIRRDAPVVWFNLACARARVGEKKGALSALSSAVDAGLTDSSLLRNDPDLAPLRNDPAFQALVARLGGNVE